MGMYLLFYLLFYPISLLPMGVLYAIAYLFYLIANYLLQYRKKVITQNLRNSFPDKNEKEIARLRNLYYHHLAQIAAEMLKMLTISRKQVLKRYHCENPEVVNQFFEQGRSVILMSSHYNNWEWMVLSLDLQYKQKGIGVGKANSNKHFEKLINIARTRYGTEVVFADHVRECFEYYEQTHQPAAYMMLSDQSPNNVNKSYLTTFMNQPSAMIFGAEHFAKKYNLPVIYYEVIKTKKGYYKIVNHLITTQPNATAHGEITEKYVQLLQKTIQNNPQYWLWSHRRWKLTVKS